VAKEWILNVATNRWGLNKKSRVGPVSQWIRECAPQNIEEWETFYYQKLSKFLNHKGIALSPETYLEDLGRRLWVKITEVMQAEIEAITERDCIQYIQNLVIYRTYEGYEREITTIYGKLQVHLEVPIQPAPDEWDRLYNVDFYIQVGGKYIGLQIKPITYEQTPEIHRWRTLFEKTHKKFEQKFGGKVFIVFSIKQANKKEIYNPEVIEEIKAEIARLNQSHAST